MALLAIIILFCFHVEFVNTRLHNNTITKVQYIDYRIYGSKKKWHKQYTITKVQYIDYRIYGSKKKWHKQGVEIVG